MELFDNVLLGLQTAMTLQNLLYCLIGCLLGTLIGVLPGVGPTTTIALLLPITFGLDPSTSLIMLAGIYYGAQYGGSTTAILVNLPGEASSAVTAIDGYKMAQKGKAGAALAIAAIGSFVAGTVATVVVVIFAPPLSRLALSFGPPEYFSLIVLGLILSVTLASGSVIKALAMIILGLLFGLVGADIYTGIPRFTFGQVSLMDGINFVAFATGIYGISEILSNLEDDPSRKSKVAKPKGLLPSWSEIKHSIAPILRGTGLGSVMGVLPGGGATLSSFASYALEKKLSRRPEEFGEGAIEGVAGPESANNAGAQTSFIPMLTLGIPGNGVMAIMIGALMIQGIQPGPSVMTTNPSLFWGLLASMWIGNFMLLMLNLPLVGIWVKLLSTPYNFMFPAILLFSAIGIYSTNMNSLDLGLVAMFGFLGYILLKLDCEPAPFLMGFILGPLLEENLRRAMMFSRGNPATFVSSPLSATLLFIALVVLTLMVLPSIRRQRKKVFAE
ncbi:tripartite tricarboxylate transporter permease [Agrobacterium pusense]|uniref:tripartite tricarboxylate transporter permease n=1 Tax=Agrobacterium pusense TaxID=648995 RepID=UPI001C6EB1F2|nr:tripartite tricarboxylate transporter permease [Agrobacterium pusense]MBW9071290.1 tripartite tricarboxylate transporter permease [Agrobacterium pusense]MBW9084335.1 tripartite tricarboxylate transporter permease [Agrobacterium pusense]MBW9124047.1 tripartite tricarboxylate transporter permease [Agrobacterium pusense]MBW9137233.1 tripartite tricarboxylate transporter permease [Agrobacterium pusense]